MTSWLDILGILAIVTTLFSFFFNGEYRLRIVNAFGAFLFLIYGLSLKCPVIWILSLMLLTAHSYKIYRRIKRKNQIINKLNSIYNYDNKQIKRF